MEKERKTEGMPGRIGAVISAACSSLRMEYYEQTAEPDDLSMVQRAAVNFQRAGVSDILVVTGTQARDMRKSLRRYGVTFLENEKEAGGELLDSARAGLAYLAKRCERIFFCPSDIPFFTPETVRKLLEAEGKLVLPSDGKRSGHPVLIHKSLIPPILAYEGEGGLKGALDFTGAHAVYVVVDDAGAVQKGASLSEVEQLAKEHDRTLMRPKIQVELQEKQFRFHAGTAALLRQIDHLGSVREACEKTGISYSKGWSILHEAESGFGAGLVNRQKGGGHGGEAWVTEKGRDLLEKYERFEREMQKLAEEKFSEFFLESDC